MTRVRVTAPFVLLKVPDANGAWIMKGLYEGAVAEDVEAENLRHHLDLGMVEEIVPDLPPVKRAPAAKD